ncbi:hypothetical protein [uncultured Ruminococcus sp.]|uniref:hypothetical protein n=1 Tax=uncultured Ruminococcus sp. TaxID=165186 RepID=UPI0026178769|nr:hypothetical protein [uncultured Ruminococcus sp.]
MNKAIKKAAAAFMALTLLGTGTAFTNTVSSKTNTLTAVAATVSPNTPHNHGQYTYTRTEQEFMVKNTKQKLILGIKRTVSTDYYYFTWNVVRCKACDGVVRKTLDYDESYYETVYYDTWGNIWYVSSKKKISH